MLLLAGLFLMAGCAQRERASYQAPASEAGAEVVVDQAPPIAGSGNHDHRSRTGFCVDTGRMVLAR